MLLPLLLLAALPQEVGPEVRVTGPAKPNAQTPATMMVEPAAMFIVACDADANGSTTRVELDACIARSFPATEAGGSIGYIAYGDWQVRWLGDQGALPNPFEVDRDGDNRITLSELQVQFGKLFTRYDRNNDKGVTRAEALTIRANAQDGRSPPGARGKRGTPPRGERVPGGRPESGGQQGDARP